MLSFNRQMPYLPTIPIDWPVIRMVPSFCFPSTGRCLNSPPSLMIGLSFEWSLPLAFHQPADALPPHHPSWLACHSDGPFLLLSVNRQMPYLPTIPHGWPVIRMVPTFCFPSTGRCLTSPPSLMIGLLFGWSLPFTFRQQADALPPHHPSWLACHSGGPFLLLSVNRQMPYLPTIPHDWPVIRVVPSFYFPSTGRCLTSPPSLMVGLSFGWSLPFAFRQQADGLPPHHPS